MNVRPFLIVIALTACGCGSGGAGGMPASDSAVDASGAIADTQTADASGDVDSSGATMDSPVDSTTEGSTDALAVDDGGAPQCPYYNLLPGQTFSSCSGLLTCSDGGGYPPCTWNEALGIMCAQAYPRAQTCMGGLTMVHFGFGIDTGEDDYYSVATGDLVWTVSTSPPSPSCRGMNPPPCVSCKDIANPCAVPGDASTRDTSTE